MGKRSFLKWNRNRLKVFLLIFLGWGCVEASFLPSKAIAAKTMSVEEGKTNALPDIVEPLIPAVVNISTVTHVKNQRFMDAPQFPQGSPLEEIFRDFFGQLPGSPYGGGKQRGQKITSLGSGFIIDPSGFVVTNNHVVSDADQVTVILNDGTKLNAKVVGSDARSDLALLKVETSKPLPYVTWGDSNKIRVGSDVFAIGNPYGLGGTVTTGIISHIGRNISDKIGADFIDGYFQTDAAINQGNSGGPLFSRDGKVIGVNTAIYSPTGASVGIGFAIPGFIAQAVIEQLKQFGRTKSALIGIKYQKVDENIAESFGLSKPMGVLVGEVVPGGPAAQAKVERGDIILKVNGIGIQPDAKGFPRLIAGLPVEKAVPMVVWRKDAKSGKYQEVTLQIKARESQPEDKKNPGSETSSGGLTTLLGLALKPLSEDLKSKLNVQGVWIAGIDPEGPAADSKLIMPGDIILEVDQDEIASVKEISDKIAAARKEKRTAIVLFLMRCKHDLYKQDVAQDFCQTFYVSVKLPPVAEKPGGKP